MITGFLIAATVLFFILFVIWTKSSTLNFVLKTLFLGMGLWGAFLTLQAFGFIVRRG